MSHAPRSPLGVDAPRPGEGSTGAHPAEALPVEVRAAGAPAPDPVGAVDAEAEANRRRLVAGLVAALPRLTRRFARDGAGPAGVEAEDLVQEVALRALRHGARYDARRPAWPWLARIARHVRADQYARADRERTASLAAGDDGPSEPPAPRAEVGLELGLREELARALAPLSPTERDVLLRFHHRGQAVATIARELDLPEGTIKSHLHRARRRLAPVEVADPEGGSDSRTAPRNSPHDEEENHGS